MAHALAPRHCTILNRNNRNRGAGCMASAYACIVLTTHEAGKGSACVSVDELAAACILGRPVKRQQYNNIFLSVWCKVSV